MEIRLGLALYKGRADSLKNRLLESVIRWATNSPFSHCEIAIFDENKKALCYTSSPRDGGVRAKRINVLDATKWEIIPLDFADLSYIMRYFETTAGKKYDWAGAVGVVLGNKDFKNRFFCSEWCNNAIFKNNNGAGISPAKLAEMVKTRGGY